MTQKINDSNLKSSQKNTLLSCLANNTVNKFKFINSQVVKKIGAESLVIPVLALGLGYGAVNPQELQAKEVGKEQTYSIGVNFPVGKDFIKNSSLEVKIGSTNFDLEKTENLEEVGAVNIPDNLYETTEVKGSSTNGIYLNVPIKNLGKLDFSNT